MMIKTSFNIFLLASLILAMHSQAGDSPKFRAQEIDAAIQIGYGLAIADVDGDDKVDIVLADKRQIVWCQNSS